MKVTTAVRPDSPATVDLGPAAAVVLRGVPVAASIAAGPPPGAAAGTRPVRPVCRAGTRAGPGGEGRGTRRHRRVAPAEALLDAGQRGGQSHAERDAERAERDRRGHRRRAAGPGEGAAQAQADRPRQRQPAARRGPRPRPTAGVRPTAIASTVRSRPARSAATTRSTAPQRAPRSDHHGHPRGEARDAGAVHVASSRQYRDRGEVAQRATPRTAPTAAGISACTT